MSVVNTRTTMGEQAALDALIAHTLTELVEDGTPTLGNYALYKQENLETVNFPNLTSVGANAMQDCVKLTRVDIGGSCSIQDNAFSGCTLLRTLMLSITGNVCTLNNSSVLGRTNFAKCDGGIYVPESKVSAYKSTTNWMPYRHLIFPDTSYPRASYATITDSWSDIIVASNDGTYDSKYSVGDTAFITINNVNHMAVLVGKNKDIKTADDTTAHMTWMLVRFYTTHNMNDSAVTTGGWADSGMRSWLSGTVLPLLPAELQTAIVEVKKTYYDYGTTSVLTSNDKLWIPSSREVCLTGGYLKEDSGCQYDGWFSNDASRIKFDTSGSATNWWLRSANSGANFVNVYTNGKGYSNSASTSIGVVFGFCI